MLKNLFKRIPILLVILLLATAALTMEGDEPPVQQPLSKSDKITPLGTSVEINSENIDEFLKLSKFDNPFQQVNVLTIAGKWTHENIPKLGVLFRDYIPQFDGILRRVNFTISSRDLPVFNALLPSSIQIMEDNLSYLIDLREKCYFCRDKWPTKLYNIFDYLPQALERYVLEVVYLTFEDLLQDLPKSLKSLKLSPHRRSLKYAGGWYFIGPNLQLTTFTSLTDFTLSDHVFSDIKQALSLLKSFSSNVTRISFTNHELDINLKGLIGFIEGVHGNVESLDFSCDISRDIRPDYNYSTEKETDEVVLDVTRLSRLRSLCLDGLPIASKLKVKTNGQVSLSAQKSRNPVINAVLEGREVSPEELRTLSNSLILRLKNYISRDSNHVYNRDMYDQKVLQGLSFNTLANLTLLPLEDEYLEDESQFLESLKKRGISVNVTTLGNLYLKAGESLDENIRKKHVRNSEFDDMVQRRDIFFKKAAEYGITRKGGVLASKILEQLYRNFAKQRNLSRAEKEELRQKAAMYASEEPDMSTGSVEDIDNVESLNTQPTSTPQEGVLNPSIPMVSQPFVVNQHELLNLGVQQLIGKLSPIDYPSIPKQYRGFTSSVRASAPASIKAKGRLLQAREYKYSESSKYVSAQVEYNSVLNDNDAEPEDRALALLEVAQMKWFGLGNSMDLPGAYLDFEQLRQPSKLYKPTNTITARAKLHINIMQRLKLVPRPVNLPNELTQEEIRSIREGLQGVVDHEGVLPQDKAIAEAELRILKDLENTPQEAGA